MRTSSRTSSLRESPAAAAAAPQQAPSSAASTVGGYTSFTGASTDVDHGGDLPVDGIFTGDRDYIMTASQVHGTFRSYLFVSVLRWLLLLTIVFSLSVPRYKTINSYYADRVDLCGGCLFQARANPTTYYEWATCATLNVTEFRAAKDANLLRDVPYNTAFTPSSDLNQIVPVSIFFYTMAMLMIIFYSVYVCLWFEKSSDPETALASYLRQSVVINIIAAACTSYMVMFSYSLMLEKECYIQSFPRWISYFIAIVAMIALIFVSIMMIARVAPCCGSCAAGACGSFVFFVAASCILLCNVALFLANLVITGHGGGAAPAIIGVLALAAMLEAPAYAAWTNRTKLLGFAGDSVSHA